jgi:hypothetical protein
MFYVLSFMLLQKIGLGIHFNLEGLHYAVLHQKEAIKKDQSLLTLETIPQEIIKVK